MATEYIKRDDAILRMCACFRFTRQMSSRILEAVPTADVVPRELYQRALSDVVTLSVERKQGKWKELTRYGMNSQRAICECSVCGGNTWVYDEEKRRFKYCPNCGARMVSDDL